MPRAQYAIFPENTPEIILNLFINYGAQFVSFDGHSHCLPVGDYYSILAQVEDDIFDSPETGDDDALDLFQSGLNFMYWSNEVVSSY